MPTQEHPEERDVAELTAPTQASRKETVAICAVCIVGIAAWSVAVYEGVRVVF